MAGFRNTRNNDSIGPYELFNDQIPHVNLYNFNGPGIDSILDPNIDWLGGSHLNETGARKFTEYISPFLLK